MNNINDPLAWLYQELLESLAQQSVSPPNSPPDPVVDPFNKFSPDWDAELWEVLEEQDAARGDHAQIGGESAQQQPPQSFAKGDLPIVYNRFEQLIRDRIHTEIQKRPPLFPWELDGELDYADDFVTEPILQPTAWLPQLQQLLPVQIPELTLLRLLTACTDVVGSVQPQGIKMADAVKVLFPGYGTQLNDVLNRIRLSPVLTPSRHGVASQSQQRLAKLLPATYQEASLEQQMAIAVLLAKTILDRLTLQLSPQQLTQRCDWQATAGAIHLEVQTPQHLRWGKENVPTQISVTVPCGGQLTVLTAEGLLQTQCSTSGTLELQLSDWEPGKTYLLNLCLDPEPDCTLQFAVTFQR